MNCLLLISFGLSALNLLAVVSFGVISILKFKEIKEEMKKQEQELNEALTTLGEAITAANGRVVSELERIKGENPDLADEISSVQRMAEEVGKIASNPTEPPPPPVEEPGTGTDAGTGTDGGAVTDPGTGAGADGGNTDAQSPVVPENDPGTEGRSI